MRRGFSIQRMWAIMLKEFILMKRDPGVIVIMAILPLILVCLAGYVINVNPKHVPTVLMDYDHSDFTRDLIQAMNNTGHFSFIDSVHNTEAAYHLLKTGKALLIMTIPVNFTKDLIRKNIPTILLEDGGTDIISTAKTSVVLSDLGQHFLAQIEPGTLSYLKSSPPAFRIISHRLYDPDYISQYNVLPGMIGLVLMLTMLAITTVISFRDVQGGTIECLLISPTQPIEILLAEILSYIIIGYIQIILSLILSYYLFHVPFVGEVWLLMVCTFPYVVAELSLGLTITTFCATQFQAVQINNLFIAFSIILTGFVFPTFGMPQWAQYLSNFIPLTHFLQILRGIMLKGNDFSEVWQNLWPLLLFSSVMITIAVSRFQRHFSQG